MRVTLNTGPRKSIRNTNIAIRRNDQSATGVVQALLTIMTGVVTIVTNDEIKKIRNVARNLLDIGAGDTIGTRAVVITMSSFTTTMLTDLMNDHLTASISAKRTRAEMASTANTKLIGVRAILVMLSCSNIGLQATMHVADIIKTTIGEDNNRQYLHLIQVLYHLILFSRDKIIDDENLRGTQAKRLNLRAIKEAKTVMTTSKTAKGKDI